MLSDHLCYRFEESLLRFLRKKSVLISMTDPSVEKFGLTVQG